MEVALSRKDIAGGKDPPRAIGVGVEEGEGIVALHILSCVARRFEECRKDLEGTGAVDERRLVACRKTGRHIRSEGQQ